MSSKKVCINSTSSYYTGKEQSPLHFGLSAEGYEINAIMEGFDKELWIVEVRNNKKVWTKKEHINKMTYEKPLITELNEETTNNLNGNNLIDTLITAAGDQTDLDEEDDVPEKEDQTIKEVMMAVEKDV